MMVLARSIHATTTEGPMSLRSLLLNLSALTMPALLSLASGSARAEECAGGNCAATICNTHCNAHHCPAPYVHCAEGAPNLKFKKGCPKPVCPLCDLPH